MATFPSVTPTYQGFSKKSAPAVRTVRFADGFEQRIFFGLASNQNPKVYNVNFELSETDADVVEAFLDSRAKDEESFTFTPPGEGFTKTGTYSQSGTTVTITISNQPSSLDLIMSDDISMKALSENLNTIVKKSYTAGCDVILHCSGKLDEVKNFYGCTKKIKKKYYDYFINDILNLNLQKLNILNIKKILSSNNVIKN